MKLDPNYKYVLFFGLIRDYKGLDLLIEAFANEEFRKLKVKLVVAGEFYGDQEKYEVLIQNLKLENEIIIHPKFIPDNEVVNYFCACDIIAQPYKTATQSGVTQVGYHFEKPMLVTNVGGLSEIIPHEKAGYAVDPNSTEIAKHLIAFFKENKEEQFIAFVKTEKLKYSWKNLIHSIEELYKKL